jgi:outer membrane protein assembly factor BamB
VLSVAAPARAPVVAGPALIVALRTGSLTAHRLTDGSVMWTVELPAEQPLASDDAHVYVASGEALHAVNAKTGEISWRLPIGAPLSAPPFAHGGWVLAAAEEELIAIRASDGAIVWRKQLGTIEFRPSLDGDLLVVPIMEGHVVALNLQDGSERWKRALGAPPGEPFAIGDRVYVGTQNKLLYSLYASSGREEWWWSVGAIPRGRAAVDDRQVYFVAMDHVVRALNRRTGSRKWMKGLPYRPAAGPVVIGTRVLVPGQSDAPLPAFDTLTGDEAGSIPFPVRLVELPVFAHLPDGTPVIVGITGGLENRFSVILLGPSLVPPIAVQPLTALPGEAVPLPQPPAIR